MRAVASIGPSGYAGRFDGIPVGQRTPVDSHGRGLNRERDGSVADARVVAELRGRDPAMGQFPVFVRRCVVGGNVDHTNALGRPLRIQLPGHLCLRGPPASA